MNNGNIRISTLFLALIFSQNFSLYSWDIKDMHPAKLFNKQEPIVAHEFIKVTPTTSFKITQPYGAVKVKGWNKDSIKIKITKKGSAEQIDNTEIAINKTKLPEELSCTISAKNDQKQIAEVAIHAHIPHQNSVTVISEKGSIITRDLHNTQSLTADNGNITILLDKFPIESSIFVHNKYGHITLEAPKKIQAQLSATTLRGSITSEIFITLQAHTTLVNKEYWQRIKKEVHGDFGDGGAPITLEAENGDIKIIAKK